MFRIFAYLIVLLSVFITASYWTFSSQPIESNASAISPHVSETGDISVPSNYREWAFLGTWSIAKEDVKMSADASGHGAAGLHNVYTQPSTIEAYRETGNFPDGAVLVKELLTTKTERMTTGQVSWGNEIEGWFVMVKDSKNSYPDNPLWGNGWGWSLFNANDPLKTVSTNFRIDCLGCHIPAQSTDWVYVKGYPPLRKD